MSTKWGGVMSIVWSRANNLLVDGKLTPEEGIKVVRWAIMKEAELKAKTNPKEWEEMVRDSLGGRTLADGGEERFKKIANEKADLLRIKRPY